MVWSLVPAGIILALWVVALVVGRFDRPKAQARAVEHLAQLLRLAVPPGYEDRLIARMRRRGTVLVLILGPIAALWMGWMTYAVTLAPEGGPRTESPILFSLPFWALGALALAASHVYDSLRSSKESGPRVARIVEPALTDAVPPVLLWAARAVAVLPLLAALVWLIAPVSVQYASFAAARPQPVLYAVAVVLCPALVAGTELGQKRILSGRQNAATPQELAFDDALRVQAVLALLNVPFGVCISAALLIASPLGDTAGWSGDSAVFAATMIVGLSMYLLPLVTRSQWASRYYLRRFAAFSQPGPAAAC
ncbi:hypothetical protein [Actinospica robiniae]|uniref:hypothetical protein n=1 Tax=Actinospica robiniae TaxID=304901 RepID=UPI0012F94029|nr:hypothetical protein [Actinospica robiniae]